LKFWEINILAISATQKWLELKPKHEKKLQQEADQAV
jgi:hypothetical protein